MGKLRRMARANRPPEPETHRRYLIRRLDAGHSARDVIRGLMERGLNEETARRMERGRREEEEAEVQPAEEVRNRLGWGLIGVGVLLLTVLFLFDAPLASYAIPSVLLHTGGFILHFARGSSSD